MEDTVSEIYNKGILKLDEKYYELSNARKKDFHPKYNIGELLLSDHNHDNFFIPSLDDKKCHPSHH